MSLILLVSSMGVKVALTAGVLASFVSKVDSSSGVCCVDSSSGALDSRLCVWAFWGVVFA